MKGWQKIYSSGEAYQADIVKAVLEDRGMNPVLIDKKDSAYTMIGESEIYVAKEHALAALNIIKNDIDFK